MGYEYIEGKLYPDLRGYCIEDRKRGFPCEALDNLGYVEGPLKQTKQSS